MSMNTAVVAGASGLIGRRIAERLLARGWNVIGLARRPAATPGMRWIAVDLCDADDCVARLRGLDSTTHVFYAARFDHPEGQPEAVDTNAAMLGNLVNALERHAPLAHVHAVHGSKYYGHQLGPVPFPMREDTPRAKNRNFYFDQEDFLIERSRKAGWTYSTSRPHAFCDPAIDHPRSFGLVVAVYAAIQRELGRALDFPGGDKGYDAHTQFTDLGLLARAAVWMATEPRCANQSFNVVNGDTPRWRELWEPLAQGFGLGPGTPRRFSLAEYMRDKGPVWARVVEKHGLRKTDLHALVLWAYGDYQLGPDWDIGSSMDKARALGFSDSVDSLEMFRRQFRNYRDENVVPSDGGGRRREANTPRPPWGEGRGEGATRNTRSVS
jgi:nucleoside-diphosphate-sugar epimerase